MPMEKRYLQSSQQGHLNESDEVRRAANIQARGRGQLVIPLTPFLLAVPLSLRDVKDLILCEDFSSNS